MMLRPLSLVLLFGLAACGALLPLPASAACPTGTTPMLVTELFFGRNLNGVLRVTNRDWKSFVADTLSRQLPGFTVTDALGQYLDTKNQKVTGEKTKFVIVALDDNQTSIDTINAIITAYKTRFQQQSVGVLFDRSCGSFGS